jgi:hypothetical protein
MRCALVLSLGLASCAHEGPWLASSREQGLVPIELPPRRGEGMGPRIYIEEVLVGTSVLVLELRHQDSPSNDDRTEVPALTLTAKDCPLATPRHDGELAWAGRGRLAISLADLPPGWLYLTVRAFDSHGSVVLYRDPSGEVRTPTRTDRRAAERVVPSEPGSTVMVHEVGDPQCPVPR